MIVSDKCEGQIIERCELSVNVLKVTAPKKKKTARKHDEDYLNWDFRGMAMSHKSFTVCV
jgi:hypothetical protein